MDPATLSVRGNVNTVTLAGKAIRRFESLAVARTGTAAVGDQSLEPGRLRSVMPTLGQWPLMLLALLLPLDRRLSLGGANSLRRRRFSAGKPVRPVPPAPVRADLPDQIRHFTPCAHVRHVPSRQNAALGDDPFANRIRGSMDRPSSPATR